MKRLIALYFTSSLFFISVFSLDLSENSQVYLLTCSPGEELYATFGHSAIRVTDVENELDLVFNYGIFSFSEQNFLYKFIKGHTYYMLGIEHFDSFIDSYDKRSISVFSQELNLNLEERNRLFALLLENAKEENRTYLYNFFYDNCATRPRDMIEKALPTKIVYEEENEKTSFRDLLEIYTGENTWLKFGIDLLIASPADKAVSLRETMFLPEFLKDNYHHAWIEGGEEKTPLLINEELILSHTQPKKKDFPYPLFVFSALFLFVLWQSLQDIKYRTVSWYIDYSLLTLLGLASFLLVFISFFSIHPAVFPNFNLLWIHPFYLLLLFFLLFKKEERHIRLLLKVQLAFLLLALVAGLFLQNLNMAVYPLILMLLVRHVVLLKEIQD